MGLHANDVWFLCDVAVHYSKPRQADTRGYFSQFFKQRVYEHFPEITVYGTCLLNMSVPHFESGCRHQRYILQSAGRSSCLASSLSIGTRNRKDLRMGKRYMDNSTSHHSTLRPTGQCLRYRMRIMHKRLNAYRIRCPRVASFGCAIQVQSQSTRWDEVKSPKWSTAIRDRIKTTGARGMRQWTTTGKPATFVAPIVTTHVMLYSNRFTCPRQTRSRRRLCNLNYGASHGLKLFRTSHLEWGLFRRPYLVQHQSGFRCLEDFFCPVKYRAFQAARRPVPTTFAGFFSLASRFPTGSPTELCRPTVCLPPSQPQGLRAV